jgi:hypothetical protein
MIDGRGGMAAVGNLDDFLKFKAASALGDAAAGGSGDCSGSAAGSGMGLGLGAGLGLLLPGMLVKSRGGEPLVDAAMLARGVVRCPECHGEVAGDSRFCAHCGHQMVTVRRCSRCSKNVTALARFCPSCGLDLAAVLRCARCTTALPPGTRFCFHCGERVPGVETPAPTT